MKIIHANALPGYRLEMKFENDESGTVDVSSFVGVGIFAALEQPRVFEQV
jgi:hypothetical protein